MRWCVCVCLSGALLNFAQKIPEAGTQNHTASNSTKKQGNLKEEYHEVRSEDGMMVYLF